VSLDQASIEPSTFAPLDGEAAPAVAATFLRHALSVWAREHGLTGDMLSAVVDDVMQHADASIRRAQFGRGAL
jgi:hypothetical protein